MTAGGRRESRTSSPAMESFGRRRYYNRPLLEILNSEADGHATQRRLANPAFSAVSVRMLHDIMIEEVAVMCERIDAAGHGRALDPDDLFSRLALVWW